MTNGCMFNRSRHSSLRMEQLMIKYNMKKTFYLRPGRPVVRCAGSECKRYGQGSTGRRCRRALHGPYTGGQRWIGDLDWVGDFTLKTRLTGGRLAVRLSETGTSYYNVFVDGKLHNVVKACGKDTVIDFVSGVSRNAHALRIQKRTEGEFGKTTIHRFLLPQSGALQQANIERSRHIEFIGNSLTCGYGTEGKDRNEPFKLETENCNLSFPTIVSRYFDADYTLVAHSGRGAVRNYGDTRACLVP